MSNSFFESLPALLKFKSTTGLNIDTSSDSVCGLILEKKILYNLKSKCVELFKEEKVIENGYYKKTKNGLYVEEIVSYFVLPTRYGEIDLDTIMLKIERIKSSDLKGIYESLIDEGIDVFIRKVYPRIGIEKNK